MKITQIKKWNVEYFGEDAELPDSLIHNLEMGGVDEIRYCYKNTSYDGIGHILMLRNGKWYHENISHGTMFNQELEIWCNWSYGYRSLDALLDGCSEELQQEIVLLCDSNKDNTSK